MTELDWSWSLTEGYSNLVDGARVDLQLRKGPVDIALDFAPAALVAKKRPVRLVFGVKRGVTGRTLGSRWRIRPGSRVSARVLFPGNAFLGNFRVPENHTAVQWDVEVEVVGALTARPVRTFLQAEVGTRVKHSWVEVFQGFPIRESLERAWKNFVDPLAPGNLKGTLRRQVVRVVADGTLRFEFAPEWGVRQGWVFPSTLVSSLINAGGGFNAGASLQMRLEEKGSYQVQLTRETDRIDLTVRRNLQKSTVHSLGVGLGFFRIARVRRLGALKTDLAKHLIDPASAPLVRSLNRQLSRSLVRRVETSFRVESERSRRRAVLLKASWGKRWNGNFEGQYNELLRGRIPTNTAGVRISGVLERVRSRRLTIVLNLFHWKSLGLTREKREYFRTSQTPDGNVLLEQGVFHEKKRAGWDTLQFLRLLVLDQTGGDGRRTVRWSFGRQGKLSLGSLRNMLRMALHAGIISDFVLPDRLPWPLQVELVLLTEFQVDGLAGVRNSGQDGIWRAVVRSFELAQPDRYQAGSYRRDWIESPSVRELVRRYPAQAHLPSRYPISGRTDFQRRQVVDTYRQVKHFLEMMELWRERRPGEVARFFELNLDLPIFVIFHLLCPPELRRSAARLSGELDRIWGDGSLLLMDPD